jgi:hypothetical protein
MALAPVGASGQEVAAPARTFLLHEPVPGLVAVPEGTDVSSPGPVDLAEAGWFSRPEAPDDASRLLEGLGFREGHFAMWVNPTTLQGVSILLQSFDRRVDAAVDQDVATQRATDELGPEAELIDTSAVPSSSGFVSAKGVTISFHRGQYTGHVSATNGLPNRRRVALDLASRQYGALPDHSAPAGAGEDTADEIGRFIGQAGISLGLIALLCLGAVAVVRSVRRKASPAPGAGPEPGQWDQSPGGSPPVPAPAPPPQPAREPALAGPRRKGSTI